MSHTYALLEVSAAAYDEIERLLDEAGCPRGANSDGEIDMHGIALTRGESALTVAELQTITTHEAYSEREKRLARQTLRLLDTMLRGT